MRRKLAGVFVAVLALGQVQRAEAFDSLIATLIAEWVANSMNPKLELLDKLQVGIFNRHRWVMYPRAAFWHLPYVSAQIHGLRRELTDGGLNCGFSMSPRTLLLRGMLLQLGKLSAESWDAITGRGVRLPIDSDRERLAEWASAFAYNIISERAQAEHGSWDRVFSQHMADTAAVRTSIGEAQRDAAINVAWVAQVEVGNKRLADQSLLLEELRWADQRARARERRLQGLALWEAISQMGGGDSDPDPWPFEEVE